ncbi:MAG TPA: sialidase family protein [Candidatus Acidoferrales bacterium]|nr:sialidase family protein [Candidatus Acidoferrales bacterium]
MFNAKTRSTRLSGGGAVIRNLVRTGWLLLLASFSLFIFPAGHSFAQSLLAPPDSHLADLTSKPGFFNEPSIAVNPRDPQQLVAAFQVPATIEYSLDAGQDWSRASGTAPENYRVSGDVSVAYDGKGHAFLCYIAFDKLGSQDYWARGATRNGIFVRRSLDGGKSWAKNPSTVIAHPTKPGIPFEDKPYIVADDTKGAYAGNLYVGWTQFTLTKSVILFARSTDDGQTWSAPIEISSQEGLPRDDNGDVEGFSGAVAPDGTLYAVWADGDDIAFTFSKDGGKTFAPSAIILRNAPSYFKVHDVSRANGFPQLAVDPKSGRLFVSWSDYRNGDVDVFVSVSNDRGASWSSAVRVNSDPLHDGSDHFFQWLAVDPITSDAYVIFYDRRDDTENRKTAVVLARSADGGQTFQNYAWTDKLFEARDNFIGDYTGIAAFGGRVYGIWAEEAPKKSVAAGGIPKSSASAETHRTIVRVGTADFGEANN